MPLKSNYESRVKKSCPSKLKYEPIKLEYSVEYTYKPDWGLTTKSGGYILIECKGGNSWRYFNSQYRKKFLAMYEQNKGKHDIRMMFEKDFKIGKKLTASGWCRKNNIEYHIGTRVPQEWIDE
jgi:hypothetical protein